MSIGKKNDNVISFPVQKQSGDAISLMPDPKSPEIRATNDAARAVYLVCLVYLVSLVERNQITGKTRKTR